MFRRREPSRSRSSPRPTDSAVMSLPRPPPVPAFLSCWARSLVGLTVVAGLVGSLLLGLPALDSGQSASHGKQSEASQGR